MAPESRLRLMAVLAHPDDECLGFGGTLAHYSAAGVAVHLVTATRGEAGRYRQHRSGPEHPGREGLGRLREAELRAACEVLGVRDLALLGYLDGALDQAEPREAIARIARHVRRVRPQVVVTFAPDGGYGHPDHIAISQFTTAALVAAADSHFDPDALDPAHAQAESSGADGSDSKRAHAVSKLYYIAWPATTWNAYQKAIKKLVATVDGVERQAHPWPDWEITTVVDTRAHWKTVWRAVSCHDSQMSSYAGLGDLPPAEHEGLWGHQCFYRAMSTVNGGRARETDLFDGLRAQEA